MKDILIESVVNGDWYASGIKIVKDALANLDCDALSDEVPLVFGQESITELIDKRSLYVIQAARSYRKKAEGRSQA